jgi:branched-chain amino acid transport system permease protein
MSTQLFFAQILTGIATGALYFLVASGLTLVWGALGVVNLAHGSFFMIAAFSATTIVMQFGPNLGLPIALLVVPLIMVVLSAALEVSLFRRVYAGGIWGQLLLTFGLVLVINNLIRWIFGSLPRSVAAPDLLRGFVEIGGIRIAQYQVAVIVVTAIVSCGLWYLLARSRTGRLIRAAVDDPAMLGAVGVDVKVLRTKVMALSALLAGVAGVVAAPRGAVNATLDVQMVVIAFAIIVIGGLGSVWGALTAAIVVGVAESVSTIFIDQGSEIVVFALMVLVLVVKPSGLRTIIQH